MRAKDYVKLYVSTLEEPGGTHSGAVTVTFIALFAEAEQLMRSRHTMSNDALFSVVSALDQKWRSICRKLLKLYPDHPINQNGYLLYIENNIPQLHAALQHERKC